MKGTTRILLLITIIFGLLLITGCVFYNSMEQEYKKLSFKVVADKEVIGGHWPCQVIFNIEVEQGLLSGEGIFRYNLGDGFEQSSKSGLLIYQYTGFDREGNPLPQTITISVEYSDTTYNVFRSETLTLRVQEPVLPAPQPTPHCPPTSCFTANPRNPEMGQSVTLDATCSTTSTTPIVCYEWEVWNMTLGRMITTGSFQTPYAYWNVGFEYYSTYSQALTPEKSGKQIKNHPMGIVPSETIWYRITLKVKDSLGYVSPQTSMDFYVTK